MGTCSVRIPGKPIRFGVDQLVPAGELMVSDLTAPYVFSWTGGVGSWSFHVPYDQLGLPVDVVRAAGPRLRVSPLYQLVHDHLVRLVGLSDVMAADPGAAALGTATTELVRALLESAAGRPVPEVREHTLATQVLAYARQHLTDPGLTAQRIAHAHNVSVRQLYKACARADVRLEQWVIEQRLEAARAELAAPAGRRRSIGATARACGFADPSHFARRFRAAYGMTPARLAALGRLTGVRSGADRRPGAGPTTAAGRGPPDDRSAADLLLRAVHCAPGSVRPG